MKRHKTQRPKEENEGIQQTFAWSFTATTFGTFTVAA